MGKRSSFERVERDFYRTFDPRASKALEPFVKFGDMYVEPCAGDGALIKNLESIGLSCSYAFDKEPQADGIQKRDILADPGDIDMLTENVEWIITNPPWDRDLLHAMIPLFQSQRPAWLLFDAGWMFTKQAKPFLGKCSKIVTIGRLKWIEGTTMSGKDDCCWYLFDKDHTGPTEFYGR